MYEEYRGIKAPVFNIQPFSVHDGPGIRVTVFVKGCPLRCLWCANPESNLVKPQLMTYPAKCSGCGRCLSRCGKGAISMGNVDGRTVAVTDRVLCNDCGACVDVCFEEARAIAGEEKTVQQVLDKVLKDRLFIESSGGGITISGGEPLMHSEFTTALLKASKEEGLHTAIESCLYASRKVIDRVFKYVDLGILDIKHMDSSTHAKLTGVPNDLILENLKHIYHDLKVSVIISLPVIPGYNDSEENVGATARFIAEELGPDVPIRLLPYHRLGESKNDSLGIDKHLGIEVPSNDHMKRLKRLVERFGLQAQVGG